MAETAALAAHCKPLESLRVVTIGGFNGKLGLTPSNSLTSARIFEGGYSGSKTPVLNQILCTLFITCCTKNLRMAGSMV
jgi:hypothetical protein